MHGVILLPDTTSYDKAFSFDIEAPVLGLKLSITDGIVSSNERSQVR